MSRLAVIVTLAAAVCAALAGAFAIGWSLAPDPPHGIGQGWRDVCAAVGSDTSRPLEWQFTLRDGTVVASGECQ